MSSKPNPDDPRARRTRQLIQQAFMELMREKGFQQITVQDIAERATVNRATFYAHFTDKYVLMDEMIHEMFQAALSRRLTVNSPFNHEMLRLLIVTIHEMLVQMNPNCHPGAPALDRPIEFKVQSELYTFILDWLTRQQPGIAPEAGATVMSWAIFGAGFQWARRGETHPPDALVDDILRLLTHGLGTAESAGA